MAKKTKDVRIVDLNDVNFRNKDVVKWTKRSKLTKGGGKGPTLPGLKGLGSMTKVSKLDNA